MNDSGPILLQSTTDLPEESATSRAAEVFHLTVRDGRAVTPLGEFAFRSGATVREFQAEGGQAMRAFIGSMSAVFG